MLNNKVLLASGGGSDLSKLTLTIYAPNRMSTARIGSQYIFTYYPETDKAYTIKYSEISDLTGEIYVYIDGKTYVSPSGLENITQTYWGRDGTSTVFRGYITDTSKSAVLNWDDGLGGGDIIVPVVPAG